MEKHKKRGWIGILELKEKNTLFILVRLNSNYLSTHQGDFASLKRGLNPLIKLDYTITMTTVNVFLSLKPQPNFLKEIQSNIFESVYKYIFSIKHYHNSDVLHNLR